MALFALGALALCRGLVSHKMIIQLGQADSTVSYRCPFMAVLLIQVVILGLISFPFFSVFFRIDRSRACELAVADMSAIFG